MVTAGKTRKTTSAPRKSAARKKTPASAANGKRAGKAAAPQAPVRASEVRTTKITIAKPDKPKKPKLVRDSFTIPKAEYGVLQELKQRAAKGGSAVKKSELLRAGIKALNAMGDAAFAAALKAVPPIKTGRPASQ